MTYYRSWRPAGAIDRAGRAVPQEGQVVAWATERKAYRVEKVTEIHEANWGADTRQLWVKAGRPPWEDWPMRERGIHLVPARPQVDVKFRVIAKRLCPWSSREQWFALYDPWPECVGCGHLWPCPCKDEHDEAAKAMTRLEWLAAVLPGCCWACARPITGRHHSIVFDGDNLLLPGGPPAAFHTSGSQKSDTYGISCRARAIEYEQAWVAAGEDRRRRLYCDGAQFRHFDGYECDLGDLCAGPAANHQHELHCSFGGYYGAPSDSGPLTPQRNCGHKGCRGRTP